jgi:hypothetical protein
MSCNETNDNILNDEIIETKTKNTQYKPRDPTSNAMHYHKHVAPVECNICGRTVVTRALDNHKKQQPTVN